MNFLNEDPITASPTHMFSLDRRHLFQQSVLNLGRIKTCTKHPGSTFPPVLEMSHNWKVNSCWAHKSERTSLNRWKVTHKHVQKETAWGNTAMALMKRPAIEQYAIICHRWFCFIYFEKQPLRESDSWALCWLCICFMTRFWFTKGCWGFGSFNFACHPQSVKDRASIHVLSQDYGEWKANSSLLNPWSTLKTVCNMIKMKHDMCACSSLFSLDSAIHPLVSHRFLFGVGLDLGTPSAWKRPARIKQPTTWRSGSSSRLPRNWFLSFTRTSLWLAPLES